MDLMAYLTTTFSTACDTQRQIVLWLRIGKYVEAKGRGLFQAPI
jgi:hypothetical protein